MTDLVDRLRAALDHAEAVARAAITHAGYGPTGEWATSDDGSVMPADPGGNDWIAVGPWSGALGDIGVHIAANDPAHVLRTVAAHRRIIAIYKYAVASRDADSMAWNRAVDMEHVLADLASIYLPDTDQGEPR